MTKAVRGDNETAEFAETKITLRGIEYTVRELDVNEYKACLQQAEQMTGEASGIYRWTDLLDLMTVKAVNPSPAARSKPMPYPVWRRLQRIVEDMHFMDHDDAAPSDPPEVEDPDKEPEAPNS